MKKKMYNIIYHCRGVWCAVPECVNIKIKIMLNVINFSIILNADRKKERESVIYDETLKMATTHKTNGN